MSTEGTPDPVPQPSEPVGGDATPAPEPPAPGQYPPPGPDSSYASPGYYPPAYGPGGPTDPGYQQPGYQQPGYQQPGYQQPGYQQQPPGYGYQQPGYQPSYAPQPLSPSDERMWATFAHVGPIVTSFLAPLLIWLILRDRSRFVDDQGKEALNFQIFLAIAYVVGLITFFIFIGILIFLAAWVLSIVFGIQGAIVAGRGELYRYPLTWRVIK